MQHARRILTMSCTPSTFLIKSLSFGEREEKYELAELINADEHFEIAMKGDWETVVDAYTNLSRKIIENYRASSVKCETALHVAVANTQVKHVFDIVAGIPQDDVLEILKMRNGQGNTPLHLAAAIGNLVMCWCISSKDKSLIAERNNEDETPLFLAAHRGHEKAFFYLQYNYGKTNITQDKTMLINKKGNGDTVLHSAIYGEDYGFALRIIESYPDLVGRENQDKLTPLHVLALQRRSFKSSAADLGLFDLIFYYCIFIGEYTWADEQDIKDFEEIKHDVPKCPPNYKTCGNLYDMLKQIFTIIGRGHGRLVNETEEMEGNRPSTTICYVLIQILKFIAFVPLHFLGLGKLKSIANMKRKHKLAERLLHKLLADPSAYKHKDIKHRPDAKVASASSTSEGTSNKLMQGQRKIEPQAKKEEQQQLQSSEPCIQAGETPLLTAAKLGIHEIVDAILDKFPKAIEEEDCQKKNVVLLAAENRQSRVYRLLESKRMVHESVFRQVDADGNSALHLASLYNQNRPWFIPGPALQMKWEITWHEYVKYSMPSNAFAFRNKERKTAREIFIESHEKLKEEGRKWLSDTSTAYSVISTLIATVAFAASTTVPGDYDEGKPALEPEFAFSVFTISSLIALCTSMSATVFFIAILTARYELEDFNVRLPNRLQFGLTFLFASIASILVSFSSGFYFSVRNKLENAAYPIFAVMCLPVTLFAISQLPLYIGLNNVIFFRPSKKRNHEHDTDAQ
ncbi:uncharacterized protein LOC116212989 isoform X2 [Punica granatum]|uniref:Uncharacterized protein LOC116212989 isoform X2 n=1 Tax=Punica granatum TaxID=22663 RepID=A0A6P8E8M3_PUNGR|nr:uncharacterized protein LOC116212989 isoform X2 [Punica granatum]